MKTVRIPHLLLPFLFVFAACSGPAGPKTMHVWGDVSYDGKPIEEGTIDFLSTDGSAPAQAQIKNGHYDLPADAGPVAEKRYRVEISSLVKSGKSLRNVMDETSPTMDSMVNMIPPEYNVNSSLSVTVSANDSENQFDFKLEKTPGSKPVATK